METFTRELLVEASKDGDTFPCVLSTETPVERQYGFEILDHSQVDLSRSPLPLIESHDSSKLNVGIVENLRVDGKKLRGDIRLGKSARARELAEDIRARIVRAVSIGYSIGEGVRVGMRDGLPIYRFAFAPFELSLCSVGADPNAGIYRSNKPMTTETAIPAPVGQDPVTLTQERERVKSIRALGKGYHVETEATRAIEEGIPLEVFRSQLIDHLEATRSIPSVFAAPADFRQPQRSDYEGFSLSRLIAASFDNSINAGREREICAAYAKDTGRRDVKGLLIPSELMFRAVTAAGSGGNLIGDDYLADQFIDPLRKRMITARAGATVLNGLIGDVILPRMTADVTVGWLATDGASQAADSSPTFDQVTMTPKSIGVQTTVSRKMIVQGLPQVEQLVRDSITNAIARAVDSAAINGTGASNQPTGILATSGIGAVTYTAPMSFGKVVDLEGELLTDDADTGSLAYVAPGTVVSALKQKDVGTDTGVRVWTSAPDGEGRVNGYRAFSTNLMPAATMLFGNWSELLIGFWSGVDLVVDPYSLATYGSVRLTAFQDLDIAVRHAASFAKLTL